MKKNVELEESPFSSQAAAVKAERAQRDFVFPQWSGIDPAQVGLYLAAHEQGEYYESAPILEAVLRYDAQILTCFEKRVALATACPWEIVPETSDKSLKAEAEKQASILRDFFNTISVSSAFARDSSLSVGALLKHILSAVAYGYSASAVSFYNAKTPQGDPTVHATFINCPLRFFEGSSRFLRIRTDLDIIGKPLEPKKWVIANSLSTPLLIPSLVLFCLKSTPMEDWAHVVEKFGIPFAWLNTPAKEGTPEWENAKKAVKAIGSGFSAVLGESVKLNTATMAQGDAPHERIIDYIDRAISRLWLGGDLSTMSREGESVGSLAQNDALSIIAKNDRDFLEQIIDTQISRRVLDYVFGAGTRQLAYFKFSASRREDISSIVARITAAQSLGLPVSKSWLYAELGIPEPEEGEETMIAGAEIPRKGEETANSCKQAGGAENRALDAKNAAQLPKLPKSVIDAQNAVFEEIVAALESIENSVDFESALKEFEKRFPEYAGKILNRADVGDALADAVMKFYGDEKI